MTLPTAVKGEDGTPVKVDALNHATSSENSPSVPSTAVKTVGVKVENGVLCKEEGVKVKDERMGTKYDGEDMEEEITVPRSWFTEPLTLPECVLPPDEEYAPVEKFVADAVSARDGLSDGSKSSDGGDTQKAMRGYRAVLDCMRKRDDPPTLRKVLCALRTAESGKTLKLLTSSPKRHAHLLHLIFRLDPFKPPKALMEKGVKDSGMGGESSAKTNKCQAFYDYTIADAHLNLVVNVVRCNDAFLIPATNALWKLCTLDLDDAPPARTTRVHAALSIILRGHPSYASHVFHAMASSFPFKLAPVKTQIWHAKQCLSVLQYMPTIHGRVLELFVDKCLEIDVEIQIDDGGEVTVAEVQDDIVVDDSGIFVLDMGESGEVKGVGKVAKAEKETANNDSSAVDECADKLDALMLILFQHLTISAKSTATSPADLYQQLYPVFESIILTTHRSKFVQFVVFLVCGLDNDCPIEKSVDHAVSDVQPKLYRRFASRLINIVLDPYRATVIRQSAVCFLASFVCRALYVCPKTVCESVSTLLRWCESYMERYGTKSASLIERQVACETHSLFYTVCQAAFYTMSFRGPEAIRYHRGAVEYHGSHNVPDGTGVDVPYAKPEDVDISPERWAKLCSNHLQPLRYCLERVRGEFLHLSDIYELLPPTLLQRLASEDRKLASGRKKMLQRRRRSSSIRTAATASLEKKRMKGGVGGLGLGSNPLDSFFPFDPYLLRRSYPFIEPYYRNWEGSAEVADIVKEEESLEFVDTGSLHESDGQDDGSESHSEDDASESDHADAQQHHMPDPLGGDNPSQAMSYTSTASSMFVGDDDEDGIALQEEVGEVGTSVSPNAVTIKREVQRELWDEELKRTRAHSIGGDSW